MLRKLVVASVLAGTMVAGAALPASANFGTIAEVVVGVSGTDGFDKNRHDYDILLQALTTADLVDAVADPNADLTVFAPNDAAFKRTARDLGFSGKGEEAAWNYLVGALGTLGDPVDVLTNVLLYHVVAESLSPFEVITAGEIDTLLGETFRVKLIKLVDMDPDIRNPFLNLFAIDIGASNGVIHTITRVLIPLDIP